MLKKIAGALAWEQWGLIAVMAVALAPAMDWGLPNTRRMALLTGGRTLPPEQRRKLRDLREEKREERAERRERLAEKSRRGEEVRYFRNEYEVGEVLTENEKLYAFTSFILNSSAHDEMQTYSALANMDPRRLKFDPGIYIYGGAYLYPLGALIFAARAAGWIVVTTDYGRYLEAPWNISRIVWLGRAMNVVAFLGVVALLAWLGRRLWGRLAGSTAALAWALSTVALDQTLISKPHVYAAFWALLAVAIVVGRGAPGRMGALGALAAGVAAGMAMGASLPCALFGFVLAGLVFDRGNPRGSIVDIALIGAAMAAVFVATNPYIFARFDQYLLTLRGHGADEGYGYAVASAAKLGRFLREVFARGYAFPVSLIGALGIVRIAWRERGAPRRLALAAAGLVLASGLTVGELRIALYAGPFVCLLAGGGLAWLDDAARRAPTQARAATLIALFAPPVLFAGLFLRDAIWDEAWREPTQAWVREGDFTGNATIGLFGMGQPHPTGQPPFPFLDARLVNLIKYQRADLRPDYVIVGSHWRDEWRWREHPLRPFYRPIADLGNRPTDGWLAAWRVPSQANVAATVYAPLPASERESRNVSRPS